MRVVVFLLLACGNALGLAGTDLVSPAIPVLPRELGGSIASAQLVIAVSRDIEALTGLRFLQGIAASAPAVFAPPVLRALFSEAGTTRALGVLGSIESLVPALAPILGARLTAEWGWRSPFFAIAALAAVAASAIAFSGRSFPRTAMRNPGGSYAALLQNRCFLRYSLSQACVLGGLLLFVFGAPTVIVTVMHGTIGDFIWMQVTGISSFVLAATATGHLVPVLGAERMIWIGTGLTACGAVAITLYAALGGCAPSTLIALFIPMNLGLGVRGPPGFLRAILSGRGDDERASSLTVLGVMAVAAASTALLAPLLGHGLLVLGSACAIVEVCGLALLAFLPRLAESPSTR
jgi:MFS transporter, DHA1 family, multidrug resistance protein